MMRACAVCCRAHPVADVADAADADARGRRRVGAARRVQTRPSRRSRRSRRRRPPTPAFGSTWPSCSSGPGGPAKRRTSSRAHAPPRRPSMCSARWRAPTATRSGGWMRPDSRPKAAGDSPGTRDWPLAARLAEAGAAHDAGDLYAALRAYLAARLLAPDDEHLQREISGVLVQIGAPFAAGLQAAGRDAGIEARQAAAPRQPGHGDSLARFRSSLRPDRRGAGTPRVAAGRGQSSHAAGRRDHRAAAQRPRGGAAGSRAVAGCGQRSRGAASGRTGDPAVHSRGGSRRAARTAAPGGGAGRLRRRAGERSEVVFRADRALLRAARRRAASATRWRSPTPWRRKAGRGFYAT